MNIDYKKKYNEVLERAKKLLRTSVAFDMFTIERIFPELQESEDERIRKAILTGLIDCKNAPDLGWSDFGGIAIDDCITWLEKQSEKKSQGKSAFETIHEKKVDNANKVEPKFKVGDWITNSGYTWNNYTWKVIEVQELDYILQSQDGNTIDDTISYVDKHFHLWTIQDAKDGDVLYSIDSKKPFIYKERPQFSQARGYCCINRFGEFAIWNTSKCVICTDKYIPATKEQRDLLFRKMKESGYKWDSEDKELKKIEWQSGKWGEEDKQIILSIEQVMNCASFLNIVPEKIDKIKSWLKSLKQRIGE